MSTSKNLIAGRITTSRILLALVLLALTGLQGACGDAADESPKVPPPPVRWVPGSGYAGIPPVATIAATPVQETILGGPFSTDPTDDFDDPTGGIHPDETLGDLGIAALWGGAGYFTDGVHNDNAWPGSMSTTVGMKVDYPVYTISPATHHGSGLRMHGLFYRFDAPGPWRIWDVRYGVAGTNAKQQIFKEHPDFILRAEIPAEAVNVGGWTYIASIDPNAMEEPITVVFAPADVEVSVVHTLGEGVRGAVLGDTPFGRLIELRYDLPGSPFDTVLDYNNGPGSMANFYGQNRNTIPVRNGHDLGVVWQDQLNGQPWVSWLSQTDPAIHWTTTLPSVSGSTEEPETLCTDTCEGGTHRAEDGSCDDGGPGSDFIGCDYGTDCADCGPRTEGVAAEVLAAATSDAAGNIYMLHIQAGSGVPNDVRVAWLIKSNAEGQELHRRELDTSKDGLNMASFGDLTNADNHATLQWSAGRLGLMLTRTMTQSGDGLNHQGGIAVVFDDETLERLAYHGQTSGHSFSNVLTVGNDGRFLGIDLGDNYPRGVHLHRFDESGIASRVVYTFKTGHAKSEANPAGEVFPPYDDISGIGMSYFQWSNDNATYTELGGIVETDAAIAVFFATERSELDNSKAIGALNDPRDLAMVLVRPDFEAASTGDGINVITDDLMVVDGAPSTTGGFYGFYGGWFNQRNAGVLWLTDYPDTAHNVSRPKVHSFGDDILVFWERWASDAYGKTFAMQLTPTGEVTVPATELDASVRFGFREELFDLAQGLATIVGQRTAHRFVVHLLLPYDVILQE